MLGILAGCASREPVTETADQASLSVFECAQTSVSFYYLSPDDARLYLPDGAVELHQARSASGARFVGEDFDWTAVVTLDGQAFHGCGRALTKAWP